MEVLHLQDRFRWLFPIRINYYFKPVVRHNSLAVLVVIVLMHLALIFFIINSNARQNKGLPFEAIMQLHEFKPENTMLVSVPEIPTINLSLKSIDIAPAELTFKELNKAPLDLSLPQSNQSYELHDENSELYKDVFDPRLRKKLQEAHANRKPKKQNTLNTWETSGGTTLVDMGDGECITSMQKMDSRDRGTSWGLFKVRCGKTDSEKMMDNVTADLDASKHPLETQ